MLPQTSYTVRESTSKASEGRKGMGREEKGGKGREGTGREGKNMPRSKQVVAAYDCQEVFISLC